MLARSLGLMELHYLLRLLQVRSEQVSVNRLFRGIFKTIYPGGGHSYPPKIDHFNEFCKFLQGLRYKRLESQI